MFSINNNRHFLVLILRVFFLKYKNDNDAISDFHRIEGVVCDAAATATNKRTRDITDTTSRKMRVREKNTARKEEKKKRRKKNRVPNMSSQGKKSSSNGFASIVVVVIVDRR